MVIFQPDRKIYRKPVINNETGCLCRANPYDLVIEMADKVLRKTRNGISFAPGGDHSNDTDEIKQFLCELVETMRKACHLVK